MEPITRISGINNMSIFHYPPGNQRFVFFGDLHGQNQNSCDATNHCDYFNYDYTKILTYNTNCTTIGPLLFYWFHYNNEHYIKTDVLMEESYTQKNTRSYYNDVNKEINNRRYKHFHTIRNHRTQQKGVNTLSTVFPIKNMSWLELTTALLQPCFFKNPNGCQFAPYVKGHAVDIRDVEGNRISPFSLHFLEDEIDVLVNKNKNDVVRDLILIVNTLVSSYKMIIMALTEVNGLETLNTMFENLINQLTVTKTIYQKQRKAMEKINVLRNGLWVHRIAASFNKLNPIAKERILSFILQLADDYMSHVIADQPLRTTNFIDYMYSDKTKKDRRETIEGYLLHYMNHFTVLAAYTMDIYVLTKLFLSDASDVIVYTGAYHIEVYTMFFQQFATQIYVSPTFEDKKCIYAEDLPRYLDINTFREYYYQTM